MLDAQGTIEGVRRRFSEEGVSSDVCEGVIACFMEGQLTYFPSLYQALTECDEKILAL